MTPGNALTPEQDLFAANVASGMSQRKSAKAAGFRVEQACRLMQIPEVRARIDELTASPDEKLKARINAEFTILLNRVAYADDKMYDPDQHLRVLMGFAKFRGWIIDRKQVDKRSVNTSIRLRPEELEAQLQADLERLAPGALGQLQRLGRTPETIDLKAIAAGESPNSSPNE